MTTRRNTKTTKATTTPTRPRPLALAYCRVSTQGQVEDGASMDAQQDILRAECTRREWDIEIVKDEGMSGKNLKREGLIDALDRLDRGEADALLSTRLDRVSRSVVDFGSILARAKDHDWNIVLMEPNLDLTTDAGLFVAHVLSAAAEFERNLIASRTRDGMRRRAAEGKLFGRPRSTDRDIRWRIIDAARAGEPWTDIAAHLTADGIPTARNGQRWYPSSVRSIAHAAVTFWITDTTGGDPATSLVLDACTPWLHQAPDRRGKTKPAPPIRSGDPLPQGVTTVTVRAMGVPDVLPVIEQVRRTAPAGWTAEIAARPQPKPAAAA